MRNFVQEYNELTEKLRRDAFDLTGMSNEGLADLMRQEFVLKWLAAKQTTEQIAADTAKQKEILDLRQSILADEMKKLGYSGDAKGTLEDWIKFLTENYGNNPRFYGLKSNNDKMMKVESFKKEYIAKRAASLLNAPENHIIQYLYDTKLIKLENSPRFQELPDERKRDIQGNG